MEYSIQQNMYPNIINDNIFYLFIYFFYYFEDGQSNSCNRSYNYVELPLLNIYEEDNFKHKNKLQEIFPKHSIIVYEISSATTLNHSEFSPTFY